MSTVVLLDAGPLGLATNPRADEAFGDWLESLLSNGVQIWIPEIADYEVRRELLRAGKQKALHRLGQLKAVLGYLPLNTEMMLQAAAFWAKARNIGRPTASDKALDGDMLLVAQAAYVRDAGHDVLVATTNVGHLSLFAEARHWSDIPPQANESQWSATRLRKLPES